MTKSEITKEQYLRIAQKFGFTKRELELGFLKVSGFSNRRIAFMFGISEQTVKIISPISMKKPGFPAEKNSVNYSLESPADNIDFSQFLI